MRELNAHLAQYSLQLHQDAVKNRVLTTTKPIKSGSILCADKPFLSTCTSKILCHSCLQAYNSTTLQACSTCDRARYCSTECLDRDWKAGHCQSCNVLKTQSRMNEDEALWGLDLLIKTVMASSSFGINDCIEWKIFTTLLDHVDQIKAMEETLFEFQNSTAIILNLESIANILTSQNYTNSDAQASILLEYLARLSCNDWFLYDPDGNAMVGEAWYPIASLFNHSCLPNVTFGSHEGLMVVRALKDIEAGDELCVCYTGDLMRRREERREELKERF